MDQASSTSFWKEYLTTIIAIIALVQPWVGWLWQKLFRRGTIEMYESGTIEVGYSNLGPTIAVQGTLLGREREMFVRAISLAVVREADNAQHSFEWLAFRGVRFITTRPNEMAFQLPAGFLLLPSQAFRYNIVLNDVSFQQQHVLPVLEPLRTAWTTAVQQALGAALNNPQPGQLPLQNAAQAAYPAFAQQAVHVNARAHLDQQFYWNPGWYKLSMRIQTKEREVTKNWRFELSQANSQMLRHNALKAVRQVCDQYFGEYNFAYVRYEAP